MTMPHLMNCDHQGEGWCLDCVGKLHDEAALAQTHVAALQQQISEMEFVVMNRARIEQSLPPEHIKKLLEIAKVQLANPPAPENNSKCVDGKSHRWTFKTRPPSCLICLKSGPEIAELYRQWQTELRHWKKLNAHFKRD